MIATPPLDLAAEKELLCELLRLFYQLGWCTGTGGGLSSKVGDGYLMAPSGVAKERVRPDELFELDAAFEVTNLERLRNKKISECQPLFRAIYERTDAGCVIHTHSVELVAALARNGDRPRIGWEGLEMVKGIRGARYPDRHELPVIPNTPREAQLTGSLIAALEELPAHAHAVCVRGHGAYIWGPDVMAAKRHAEVYEWLCRYTNLTA